MHDFLHAKLIFGYEFDSHARKLITAQGIVGHAETGRDETGHGADVSADRCVAEGHEAEADA